MSELPIVPRHPVRMGFFIVGVLLIPVGVVGVYLPLLPGTPLLIVAAACLSRGSPRLHEWLRHHRVLGPPLSAWEDHRVIPRRAKVLATVLSVGSMTLTTLYAGVAVPALAVAWSTVVGALIYVWTRREQIPPESPSDANPARHNAGPRDPSEPDSTGPGGLASRSG